MCVRNTKNYTVKSYVITVDSLEIVQIHRLLYETAPIGNSPSVQVGSLSKTPSFFQMICFGSGLWAFFI